MYSVTPKNAEPLATVGQIFTKVVQLYVWGVVGSLIMTVTRGEDMGFFGMGAKPPPQMRQVDFLKDPAIKYDSNKIGLTARYMCFYISGMGTPI